VRPIRSLPRGKPSAQLPNLNLALVPLALNGEAAGNEIQSPMAIVILGGLLSATVLNLFVVPAVCTGIRFTSDPAANPGPG
jgi:Cu/Ag efflux pump CusA